MHIFQTVTLFNREHKKTHICYHQCLSYQKSLQVLESCETYGVKCKLSKILVLPLDAGIFFILVANLLGVFLEAIG